MTPAELLLGIVLTGTESHYEFRSVIDDKRLEHLLLAGKQILYKSHQESDVRQALGFSPKVWEGLTAVLAKAIPVLEQQSFAWKNPPAANFNGSSSDLIGAHYLSLVKDIERLNDLCTIARNLLATTKKAQNLAAEKVFDQQILKLIDVCVRVTARGFDGETNARNEERWQKVVNLYKRLLITCLQFLHNFIMHNEQRKLVLWLDLFGNSQAAESENEASMPPKEIVDGDTTATAPPPPPELNTKEALDTLAAIRNGIKPNELGYSLEEIHTLFEMMKTSKEPDTQTREAAKTLMDKIRTDMARITGGEGRKDPNEATDDLLKAGAAIRAQLPGGKTVLIDEKTAQMDEAIRNAVSSIQKANDLRQPLPSQWGQLPDLASLASIGSGSSSSDKITEADLEMPRTSQSAAETLQEAKDELIARLQEPPHQSHDDYGDHEDDNNTAAEGRVLDEDIIDNNSGEDIPSSEEDEDDDEDDFRNSPGDQERGLLTDVPLVLGPTEIEALPMIIQAGIVDNFGAKTSVERQNVKNMQAVRCHILLAQEAGRNVLRELLIFIAAWDLPDDEFYFKMMVQIMEAILKNGLMSHAYADFGQAKDIISPAQAVVIKILTHIFRARYSPASVQNATADQNQTQTTTPARPKIPAPLSRVDVLTVRYIFSVFRSNIVPETCALIYLQGQIRAGLALAEDFPLNLWDMERVYEGVYQFLEFFAVLTENNDWKRLLVEWEIVYDLVTLIKELDASIPKATLVSSMPPPAQLQPQATTNREKPAEQTSSTNGADDQSTSPPPPPPPPQQPVSTERPYSPTASPSSIPTSPSSPTAPLSPEEPSTFEWRNLKKLIVLVLSSLTWKSSLVQTQIRQHGGVDTILNCTQYDANNPYIKEHAIMCLKFLLEGNEENQAIVRGLEARAVQDWEGNVSASGSVNIRGVGVEVGVEGGRVRVRRDGARAMSVRRASEGSAPLGVRGRFAGLNVGSDREGEARVLGEDVGDL